MASDLAPSDWFTVGGDGPGSYQWNQNLEEVEVLVRCPEGLSAKRDIKCEIRPNRVRLEVSTSTEGSVSLDHELVGQVKPDESFWTLDSKRGIVSITLQKAKEAESWPGVFKGHGNISHQEQESEQKRLLLERFQLEHPGFNFSGAEVNGTCPDPSTFMEEFRNRTR